MRQFFILTKKLYFHVDNALILPILTICEQYVTTALCDTLNCLKFFYYQRVINRPNIHSKKMQLLLKEIKRYISFEIILFTSQKI